VPGAGIRLGMTRRSGLAAGRHLDVGDSFAARRLAGLLARQGRADELRAEVNAGTSGAAGCLITMLAQQGETALADRMRRFGLNANGSTGGK